MADAETKQRRLDRYRIHYYDPDRSPDVLAVGMWEYAQADQKFGMESVKSGSIIAMLYALYWAARRSGLVDGQRSFEGWGATVADYDPIDEDEDGPPGESEAPPAT